MSENPQFWNAASSSLLPLATTYGGCTPANLSLTLLTLIHLCRLHTLTKRPPCHHTFGRSARMISTCARQQTESRHTHTHPHTHTRTHTHTHAPTHTRTYTHIYTQARASHDVRRGMRAKQNLHFTEGLDVQRAQAPHNECATKPHDDDGGDDDDDKMIMISVPLERRNTVQRSFLEDWP